MSTALTSATVHLKGTPQYVPGRFPSININDIDQQSQENGQPSSVSHGDTQYGYLCRVALNYPLTTGLRSVNVLFNIVPRSACFLILIADIFHMARIVRPLKIALELVIIFIDNAKRP